MNFNQFQSISITSRANLGARPPKPQLLSKDREQAKARADRDSNRGKAKLQRQHQQGDEIRELKKQLQQQQQQVKELKAAVSDGNGGGGSLSIPADSDPTATIRSLEAELQVAEANVKKYPKSAVWKIARDDTKARLEAARKQGKGQAIPGAEGGCWKRRDEVNSGIAFPAECV